MGMKPGRLRELSKDDESLILRWRNEPRIREAMRNDDVITPQEHASFMDRILQDPTKKYYLFEDDEQAPRGLIYFVNIDPASRSAEWGIYVGDHRNDGIGTSMAITALDHAYHHLELEHVKADVLGLNPTSLRFHAKLGFQTTRLDASAFKRHNQTYDLHHLTLNTERWRTIRESLLSGEPNPRDRRTIIVGSTRRWNRPLAAQLALETGRIVHWIGHKEALEPKLLDRLAPAYVFLPHWSFIIPEAIFDSHETVIFHMTDLPFGRGGSPLQNLITRGIYDTRITALRCTKELDGGNVYLKAPLSLHGNAEEIYLRARDTIGKMMTEIIATEPTPTPQQGEATTFKRRTPEQGNIASLETINQVFDWIRMLDAEGYPNAFADVGRFRLEFTRAARYESGVQADVRITERNEEDEAT